MQAAEAKADQPYATAPTATHPATASPQPAVPDNGQRFTAIAAANNPRSDNISALAGAPADASKSGVIKQDPDAASEPASKRQKAPSAEAQAAMAIISATARLPSQVRLVFPMHESAFGYTYHKSTLNPTWVNPC